LSGRAFCATVSPVSLGNVISRCAGAAFFAAAMIAGSPVLAVLGVEPISVGQTPRQAMDAPAPQPVADALRGRVDKGNRLAGNAALREYRAALVLLERYYNIGGNRDFTAGAATQLGRGFFARADVPDARRSWRLAVMAQPQGSPGSERAAAIVAIRHRRFHDALEAMLGAYQRERATVRSFSTLSISTSDFSPDMQFDRALDALQRGDAAAAQSWLTMAIAFDPNFAQAYLLRGCLDAASRQRDAAVRDWLRASTAFEGVNTPDVRSYASFEAGMAAQLLIAMTGPPQQ
jgi:tetratricopeptide (TPR) repeat protein